MSGVIVFGMYPGDVLTPVLRPVPESNNKGSGSIDRKHRIEKPVMMPEIYDGRTNYDDWVSHFKLCMSINGWSEVVAVDFMAARLRGAAFQTYNDLPAVSKKKLGAVFTALSTRFDPQKETGVFKAQLRNRVKQRTETLSELAGAIRHLVNKAYPEANMDMKEELAKDRFIDALPIGDCKRQVRRHHPTCLDDALRHAIEEEALDKLEGDKGQSQVRTVGDKADSELEKMRRDFKKLEADFHKLQREKDVSSNRQGGGDRGQGQRYGPPVGSYGQGNGGNGNRYGGYRGRQNFNSAAYQGDGYSCFAGNNYARGGYTAGPGPRTGGSRGSSGYPNRGAQGSRNPNGEQGHLNR